MPFHLSLRARSETHQELRRSQPESTIPEIDSQDILENEREHIITIIQAPAWQLEPAREPQASVEPQTQTQMQTQKRKKKWKGKKVMRPPPPPTSDTPATRDPRGPAVRQWIYGIEVDDAYLDAWAKENNDGSSTDEETDGSEFLSEISDYCRNNRVPVSVRTGYTGRISPDGDYWEEVSVLKMTDNEYGSRTVEEIPGRWVQVCRSFMKKVVTPMWYVRA